jgi:hypothetical protein
VNNVRKNQGARETRHGHASGALGVKARHAATAAKRQRFARSLSSGL